LEYFGINYWWWWFMIRPVGAGSLMTVHFSATIVENMLDLIVLIISCLLRLFCWRWYVFNEVDGLRCWVRWALWLRSRLLQRWVWWFGWSGIRDSDVVQLDMDMALVLEVAMCRWCWFLLAGLIIPKYLSILYSVRTM